MKYSGAFYYVFYTFQSLSGYFCIISTSLKKSLACILQLLTGRVGCGCLDFVGWFDLSLQIKNGLYGGILYRHALR